jgi:hypothetical protein
MERSAFFELPPHCSAFSPCSYRHVSYICLIRPFNILHCVAKQGQTILPIVFSPFRYWLYIVIFLGVQLFMGGGGAGGDAPASNAGSGGAPATPARR